MIETRSKTVREPRNAGMKGFHEPSHHSSHVALLLGPILLAIIFLPLSFGLNRMRGDVCTQAPGQDVLVQANGCR